MSSQSKSDLEPVALRSREAVAFAKHSLATLKRRHRAGCKVGLRKDGRRLFFVSAERRDFLMAATGTDTAK